MFTYGRTPQLLTIYIVPDDGLTELGTSLLLVGITGATRLEGLMAELVWETISFDVDTGSSV